MRLHRFYINKEVGEEREITLTDLELIHQLLNVFRFRVEDKIIIFDGFGFEYECEILVLNKKNVSVKILSHFAKATRDKEVSLYLSLIKKNNFEWATEKCTEIGVAGIHPIISERSEKKDLNIERLNKIVKEASEQSGRVTLPQVFDIVSLEESVSQVVSEGKDFVVFDPSGEKHNLVSQEGRQKNISIFVGPEGGWSAVELDLFKNKGGRIVCMGENILRAETAAIIAVWNSLNLR